MEKTTQITIDDILNEDRLSSILGAIYEKRAGIEQYLFIWIDHDNKPHFCYRGTRERLVYYLEQVKKRLLEVEED